VRIRTSARTRHLRFEENRGMADVSRFRRDRLCIANLPARWPRHIGCTSRAPCSAGSPIKNGDETDIDCGGACLVKCELGAICGYHDDCASGHCSNVASTGVCDNVSL
jgi:hypothetical protein